MAASAFFREHTGRILVVIFCAANVMAVLLHGTQLNVSPGVICNVITHTVTKPAREGRSVIEGMSRKYKPSSLEELVVNNSHKIDVNVTNVDSLSPMCSLLERSNTNLTTYLTDLDNYNSVLKRFDPLEKDIRSLILQSGVAACNKVLLSNESKVINFFSSNQLSTSSVVGALEPLLPPLRHPKFCHDKRMLMDMSYMVHDFYAMCLKLKPHARTIFVDMGASLDFHGSSDMPAMYILNLYRKFGFHFDHIYAYEVTPKDPAEVFKKVPPEYLAAYHWMNVGVESDSKSSLNPLQMLAENYNKDDFIVVKLDIDTSFIEVPLVYQLVQDDRFIGLVDQFYFEHHVYLQELARSWGKTMNGTVSESLRLFQSLRRKGIGAHSWV